MTPYMDFNKKGLDINSFLMAQFNYCPLIWMCHSKTYKNKINRLHEIYNDKRSSFEVLWVKDNSVFIHYKSTSTSNPDV